MDDIEQPGRPGTGNDDPSTAGPTPPPPAQEPPCAAPPPPYAPPPLRRLTRRDDGKVIAGVAGGIGRHLGVDANLVRVAFAVLSFTGGVGFLLYIAGWLLLPSDSEPEAIGITLLRRLGSGGWRAYVAVVIGAIAIAILAGDVDPGHPGLVWGLILLGLGIALLIRDGDAPPTPPAPRTPQGSTLPPGPPPTAQAWTPPPASPAQACADLPAPTWQAWPRAAARQRRRRRSPMTRITLAAALLVAAGAGFLGDAGVVDVTVQSTLALCLTVVGVGLLAGSFLRPPRGLIGVGVLLVPVVLAAGISDVPLSGGAGVRLWEPQTVAQLRDGYHLAAGGLTVDLRQVPFTDAATTLRAQLGMGSLDVIVPANVPLDVHARVGAGEVRLLDRQDDGLAVDTSLRADGSGSAGRLTLDLSAGLGSIQVRRADAAATTQGAL